MKFFTESQMVSVSLYNQSGWWKGNTEIHVAAGTALPLGCTENIYTPSAGGQTGHYASEAGAWTEVEDKTGTPYWNADGVRGEINTPDGTIPNGCTGIAPPEHNSEKQFAVFQNGAWIVRESHLGKPYWDENQVEYIVTDRRWECPADHTLSPPPTPKDGYGFKLIDSAWKELPDYTGTTIWNRTTREERVIQEVGEVWDAQWTELPPPSPFHLTHDGSAWILDEPSLAAARRKERDGKITGVYIPASQQLTRWIDSAEGEPAALAYYKTQRTAWHVWADALCDLPEQPTWPWPDGEVSWPEQPPKPTRYNPT